MDVKVLLSEYKTVDIPDSQIINLAASIIRKKHNLPKNISVEGDKIFRVANNSTSHTWTTCEFHRMIDESDKNVLNVLEFLDSLYK